MNLSLMHSTQNLIKNKWVQPPINGAGVPISAIPNKVLTFGMQLNYEVSMKRVERRNTTSDHVLALKSFG